jgi:hypothetical protein
VRDAGEEGDVGYEQASEQEEAAEKLVGQSESRTRLGAVAPSPGWIEVVDFSFSKG